LEVALMSQSQLVLLAGGPFEAPRIWRAPAGEERVKVADGAGYDHFVFTQEYAEHDGERIGIFRWCYRTLVAE
jgi:hypothetical protein